MFADLAGRSVALYSAAAPSEFDSYSIDVALPWDRHAIMNYCMAGEVCLMDEYLDVRGPQIVTVPFEDVRVQISAVFRLRPFAALRRFLQVTDVKG